jgi:hypothetical protein
MWEERILSLKGSLPTGKVMGETTALSKPTTGKGNPVKQASSGCQRGTIKDTANKGEKKQNTEGTDSDGRQQGKWRCIGGGRMT